jgi:hypothetical protein
MIYLVGDNLPVGNFVEHSRFKEIVNYINKQNEILSIALHEKYAASNTIIFEFKDFENIKKIQFDGKLFISDFENFSIENITVFESRLDCKGIKINDIKINVDFFIRNYIDKFNEKSLAFLIDGKREKYFETRFEKAYVKYMNQAFSDISSGKIIEGVSKMKGAGFGLTPGGDDFIAGMLFGLDILQKTGNQDFEELKTNIFQISKGKNQISNNLLKQAYEGRYFKRLKDFSESLIFDKNDISEKFDELKSVGETSGSDLLTGLVLTIKMECYATIETCAMNVETTCGRLCK